jgi:Ca2+-binding EF-hand superfamily protein
MIDFLKKELATLDDTLKKVFDAVDKDGSGFIDSKEL